MTTVAVMQPYFVPYAGYFRLFAAADVLVMFDCVQFPRRGWVHRNRLPIANGSLDWFTLPISKAPYDARIADLAFAPNAANRLTEAMRRFPVLQKPPKPDPDLLAEIGQPKSADVTEYLCDLLKSIAQRLKLTAPLVVRSSEMNVPSDLRAQDRVIAIARQLGAKRYVNPPGGRELYDRILFGNNGIDLTFLRPFAGDHGSILSRLLSEDTSEISKEIVAQAEPTP